MFANYDTFEKNTFGKSIAKNTFGILFSKIYFL